MHAAGRSSREVKPWSEKAKSRKRSRSFSLSRSRLPFLLMLFLLGYLAVSFTSQFGRLAGMQKDVSNIQKQMQELEQKNASLREELRMVQSDAYIEKTAREKLGLIKPNETRVIPVPAGNELKKIQPPAKTDMPGE